MGGARLIYHILITIQRNYHTFKKEKIPKPGIKFPAKIQLNLFSLRTSEVPIREDKRP